MKNIIALLAVLGLMPAANAAVDFGGSYRLQYSATNNFTDADDDAYDKTGVVAQRTRVNADSKVGEKMAVHVGLVHNTDWGSNADQTPDAADGDDTLTVNEGYMTWMINDNMSFKAGRSGVTIANGAVVSANEWEAVHYAFDGGFIGYDHEFAKFTVGSVRAIDAGADIAKYSGVSVDFKSLPSWLKTANFHYFMVSADEGAAAPTVGEDSTRMGIHAAGAAGMFNYGLTYAMHDGDVSTSGTDSGVKGSMMELEFGWSNPDMKNIKVGVLHHTDSGDSDPASGDDETYAAFYYEKHANAGLMDIVGWGNLTYNQVKFSMDLTDDLSLAADYYMFTQTEANDATYSKDGYNVIAGGTAIVAASAGGDDDLGTELDLTLTKKYSNNFNISASYRQFAFGDAFGSDADAATQYYVEGNLTF